MFGTAGQTIKLYLHILKDHRASTFAILFLIVAATVSADIVAPYFVAKIFNVLAGFAEGNSSIEDAKQFFVYFLVASVAGMVTWRAVGFWAARRQATLARELEQYVFDKLTRHSYTFFTNESGGALVAQSRRFINHYQGLEDEVFFSILPMATRLIFSLAVLLIAIPSIGLALLIWSAFFIGSVTWMVVRKQGLRVKAAKTDSDLTGHLADVITNVMALKSFGRRGDEVSFFSRLTAGWRKIRLKSWTVDEWVWTYTHVLSILFAIVTIWLSIVVIEAGTATIGAVLLAQFYVTRTSGDLSSLQGIMQRISRVFGDTAEMTVTLNTPPGVQDVSNPEPLKMRRARVEFDNIGFTYDAKNPVFKRFSATIKPGERIGLVGHSGSGKSTLVRLLLRFVDLKYGQILIDGQNIAEVAQDDLRSHIAYVPQEPILFHRSIMENIRYSRPEATDRQVRQAAKLAHADEFIRTKPDGYDSLVGERGIKLSGGEKQRVAIARAMLSKAPILVLDEATSSLDSKKEQLITDALKNLMQKRTTIAIAHRLSTIQNLDRIIVMDHGKIVDQGSHRHLLKSCPLYRELWKHQAGGFLDD